MDGYARSRLAARRDDGEFTMTLRLAVGLGNPTSSYTGTRHNIGRDFIEHLASTSKGTFQKIRPAVHRLPDFFGPGTEFWAAQLPSYMNQSGPALRQLLQATGMDLASLVVLVDDFMIPFGTLRLRTSGSAGGHNGLKSIIETFGSEAFMRLRVGVGPVPEGGNPADFVLEPFTKTEWQSAPKIFDAMTEGLRVLGTGGAEKAMTAINRAHL